MNNHEIYGLDSGPDEGSTTMHRAYSEITVTGIHVKHANCMLRGNPTHVTLGWSRLGDMTNIHTRWELQRIYEAEYTEYNARQEAMGLRQVGRFLFDINPGDIVVFFSNPYAYFGVVEGPYYHHHFPGDDPDYMNHKNCTWIAMRRYEQLPLSVQRFVHVAHSVFALDARPADKQAFLGCIDKELNDYWKRQ
ncbi:MAG: hypothetical protein LUD50_01505 [Clostridia bacterium]|nr:hypothetical protein [Clostridia bacterium]